MIIFQVLGEGMFGEVKLLVNKENGEACAMKEIDLDSHPEAEEVKKRIDPFPIPLLPFTSTQFYPFLLPPRYRPSPIPSSFIHSFLNLPSTYFCSQFFIWLGLSYPVGENIQSTTYLFLHWFTYLIIKNTIQVVKKEICVHKLLKHKNIVQCYGSRLETIRFY